MDKLQWFLELSFNNEALHLDNEYIYIIGMEVVRSNSKEDSKSACYFAYYQKFIVYLLGNTV